ncbi:unnamed protein product [Tilletia caries]|uniref:Uncharacterized protein n=3 Tax=Tilletia TaxID=13289 RepID=A0ABN7J9D7_9BASI|nr:unnamed protein product [Tilletia caries]
MRDDAKDRCVQKFQGVPDRPSPYKFKTYEYFSVKYPALWERLSARRIATKNPDWSHYLVQYTSERYTAQPDTQRTIPQVNATSASALPRQEADLMITPSADGIPTQEPGREDANPVATPSEVPSTTQSSSNPTGKKATPGGETTSITPTSPSQPNPSDSDDPKLRAAEDVTEEELKKLHRETIVNLLQSRGKVNSRAHKETLDSELLAQHKIRAFKHGDVAIAEAEVSANKRTKRVRPSRRTAQDAAGDTNKA